MQNSIEIKRHSLEHVMVLAIQNIFGKDIKLGVGPVIEHGFYQDIDFGELKVTDQDFEKIEEEMRKIIKSGLDFKREEIDIDEAIKFFDEKAQTFKVELLNDIKTKGTSKMKDDKETETVANLTDSGKVSMYTVGTHRDLCRGPHVENTKELDGVAFKLDRIAGAYWRGNEKNPMLTRIYAVAFESKEDLESYYALLEEARKRDHKKLGKELGLFTFFDTAPGCPYWLPKGLTLYNQLVDYWRVEHRKRGYQEIASPLINKKELYEQSGHWEHYKDDLFIADMGDQGCYCLKPMNCPNAMNVFGMTTRSYKELPMRLSDTDRLHRFELAGALNGLLRARSFQQDDAHNFVTEDLIESEYIEIFKICEEFYKIFGLEYRLRLGTRPESRMGDDALWDKAEEALKKILANQNKEYFILEGDGAFYGPKVDILMKDALGREWQMGTIQLDFQLPLRFDLKYIDKDGKEKTPIVIHRVIYGSLERFIGLIVEHFAGAFPLWISPVQVTIVPISNDKHLEYAKEINKIFLDAGIRSEVDDASETMNNKIRIANEQKVNYIVVVGDREAKDGTVSVRGRGGKNLGVISNLGFVEKIIQENSTRSLNSAFEE